MFESIVKETRKTDFDLAQLNRWLSAQSNFKHQIIDIEQFVGGYSNLTYLLKTADGVEFVLRCPPAGAKAIKKGHDMAREYRILRALQTAGFDVAPSPLLLCEDEQLTQAPFYLMERVKGIILRPDMAITQSIPPDLMRKISISLVDTLVHLHALDIQESGLATLGKPNGYIRRQVDGWQQRYEASATDELPVMNELYAWLDQHLPEEQTAAFIHNDFKFDNVILAQEDVTRVKTILDWEMSTVADPLMDVGVALSYWVEAGDSALEKTFNLSWLPGCITRKEFVDHYAAKSGRDLSSILFYYVFGLYKNTVVLQQIYHRWKKGLSTDARFGQLIHGVHALSRKAEKAINKNAIN